MAGGPRNGGHGNSRGNPAGPEAGPGEVRRYARWANLTFQRNFWNISCVQVCAVNLSQVLELAVQVTRDWVSARPRWGRVEWSRCAVWAARVPETTGFCHGQLDHLRQRLERERLSPAMARPPAVPLVAEALATDLVVRLWLCCWARQALDLALDSPQGQPVNWARGLLPESFPGILNSLVVLRQGVLEMLLALQVTTDWTGPVGEPDLECLRRLVEVWNDRLTGTLVAGWGHPEFCLHPTRALGWGRERRGWRGVEGPVSPWEWDLLAVRALGPRYALPGGPGDDLRRGILSLLTAGPPELALRGPGWKKPGIK